MIDARHTEGMRQLGDDIDGQAMRTQSPGTVAAAGLAALAVAMGIGRFAFTPILPMMQTDGGLSVADGGWLASANYLGYLIGAAAVSVLARRLRATAGIRAGLLVIAASTLGMGVEDRFAVWIVLRAAAGVGSAAVLVLASAWSLERLAATRRPLLSGTVFAGVGVGIAGAGATCLVLTRWTASAAQAWLALGTLATIMTLAIWPVFKSDQTKPPINGPAEPKGSRWSTERVWLVVCYGAFGFGYIIPSTFLPAMARQVISDPLVFGWAWPLFGAAAAGSTLIAATAARFIGRLRLFVVSQLVMALGVALPVCWPGIDAIMVSALLVGGTFMVITLVGMQEARALAGVNAAGLMAAMTTAFAAGQIAGPVGASFLAGVTDSLGGPLLLASGVLIASAGALAIRGRLAAASARRRVQLLGAAREPGARRTPVR
jgi:predicted MFS family arabinose efflux permease